MAVENIVNKHNPEDTRPNQDKYISFTKIKYAWMLLKISASDARMASRLNQLLLH